MIKLENVGGIIWDLDGTLLDSFGVFEQVIADVVTESGHTMPTHEYMLDNYHGSLNETVQRILDIQSAEELDKTVESFLAKQEHHYANGTESHLFPDAVALAQRGAENGVQQLLVTNRGHKNRGYASPRAIVASTTLASCIHEVRPGDEVAYRKPDKRAIHGWMEQHNLNPGEVVVIGDQFVDAQLALNIGVRAILVARNGTIPHLDNLSNPDHTDLFIIDSLANIELV